MAILKIERSDVATKGLVDILIDGVSNKKNYKQFKPSELEALNLIELEDGSVQIAMRIGQTDYNFTNTSVEINGVDQTGQTIDQIKDTLSLLFIDSTGGGGGTTDVSTPPHVVYKSDAGQLDNSPTEYTVGDESLITQLSAGAELQRIENTPSQTIYKMLFDSEIHNIFSIEKKNGAGSEDFSIKLGRQLQALRLIRDAVEEVKKIIIGNDNDLVPLGQPLLRTTLDELLLQISSQVRDGAQENMIEVNQGFDFYEVVGTAAEGTTQKTMIRVQTFPDPLHFIFKAILGPETNPEVSIKIEWDTPAGFKRIIMGDPNPGGGPYFVLDQVAGLYKVNAGSLPSYTSDVDAGLNGLVAGDLYSAKVAGVTGDVYAIAVKQ